MLNAITKNQRNEIIMESLKIKLGACPTVDYNEFMDGVDSCGLPIRDWWGCIKGTQHNVGNFDMSDCKKQDIIREFDREARLFTTKKLHYWRGLEVTAYVDRLWSILKQN